MGPLRVPRREDVSRRYVRRAFQCVVDEPLDGISGHVEPFRSCDERSAEVVEHDSTPSPWPRRLPTFLAHQMAVAERAGNTNSSFASANRRRKRACQHVVAHRQTVSLAVFGFGDYKRAVREINVVPPQAAPSIVAGLSAREGSDSRVRPGSAAPSRAKQLGISAGGPATAAFALEPPAMQVTGLRSSARRAP